MRYWGTMTEFQDQRYFEAAPSPAAALEEGRRTQRREGPGEESSPGPG